MSSEEHKYEAAAAALKHLPHAGVVGLGTGSTAQHFIAGVARLVAAGRELVGVPTSAASRKQAESLGIPLLLDEGPWQIDVCVDGADEISEDLDLIKGGGGCHAREKIVNMASAMNIVVADTSKLSSRLGKKWPVPIEVLPFGVNTTAARLAHFGRVERRMQGNKPAMTDNGNAIIDLTVGEIVNPNALDAQLSRVPGVVETGLFVGRVDLLILAGPDGVLERHHPRTATGGPARGGI